MERLQQHPQLGALQYSGSGTFNAQTARQSSSASLGTPSYGNPYQAAAAQQLNLAGVGHSAAVQPVLLGMMPQQQQMWSMENAGVRFHFISIKFINPVP